MSTILKCIRCGKEFKVFPSSTRGIKCCSRKCRIQSIEERFWKHVDKKLDNECWEWKGAKVRGGYGNIGTIEKKNARSHQLSWEIHNGEIPDGMCVCHICDNPICVNPNHLFLGTLRDNAQDMIKKGRRHDTGGENNGHAKLTWRKVRAIRKRYIPYKITQQKLAKEYGVTTSIISEVINGNTWKE